MAAELQLFPISAKAAADYYNKRDLLSDYVNNKMYSRNDLAELIGDNPYSVMEDNHKNHVEFMSIYFQTNHSFLLRKTIDWVVRSYLSRGFSYDYFRVVLPIWQQAVVQYLDLEYTTEINSVYEWMIKELEEVDYKKSAVSTVITSADETAPEIEEHRQFLINYILAGDHKQALKLIHSLASDAASLQAIYVDLIMPVMYAIGNLWEQGQITTAHEHLATSIVIRIMSDLYGNAAFHDQTRGKAIVSSAANENHEIGARMVADILQLNGWQVFYLGADTPEQKIIDLIKDENPDLLALSITMSYNIKTAANIINSIRSHDSCKEIKIIVGGLAFNQFDDSNLSNILPGADLIAKTLEDTILTANKWWDEGTFACEVY